MVKHIIIWKLKEDVVDPAAVKAEIKEKLESLAGVIPGLLKMRIRTEGFDSSSGDLMMDSAFENEEALRRYQEHPAHLAAANGAVRPNVSARLSFDFEE